MKWPKSVVIGDQRYEFAIDVIRRGSNILSDPSNINKPLVGADATFAADVLNLHPRRREKVAGREISHFEVRPRPEIYKRSFCFVVVFTNGEAEDFSLYRTLRHVVDSAHARDQGFDPQAG